VATHVERVFATKLPLHLRELLPARYLDLEKQRLIRLISEWLDCEAARETFSVIASEFPRAINVEGLIFHFRLDRLDHLKDQSVLVIDYKTGDVSQKSWDTPRPEDVQLPLYAVEALDRETEPLGGLVFAKLRTGKLEFAGRVGDAASTLLPDLKPSSTLVKSPLTFDQVEAWRDCIHQLARDFLAGRADVNPRDYPKTCERCECACLCRVKEGRALFEDCDESGTVEPADD
jgi:RecB family exonuclease